jgi:hypothetical protein
MQRIPGPEDSSVFLHGLEHEQAVNKWNTGAPSADLKLRKRFDLVAMKA